MTDQKLTRSITVMQKRIFDKFKRNKNKNTFVTIFYFFYLIIHKIELFLVFSFLPIFTLHPKIFKLIKLYNFHI
ncbi:hypothetical protein BpHYR1_033311 [Brachionus plicatilis]|uniref:Uncharacterized protein n=1 Tax=Brachionus plicatilis TaxID=10195 RepID=A0A3M7SKG4_BRAPC|nr:hypothetical protein BpHYR1_033311 [Brachionus plicatilis]